MKAKDVVIGETYVAKVSGRLVAVRIDREAGGHCGRNGRYMFAGWYAVNTETGRDVRIRTAGRLRGPASCDLSAKEYS